MLSIEINQIHPKKRIFILIPFKGGYLDQCHLNQLLVYKPLNMKLMNLGLNKRTQYVRACFR